MSRVFITSLTLETMDELDSFAADCGITRGEALEFLVLQGIKRVDDSYTCDCVYCKEVL